MTPRNLFQVEAAATLAGRRSLALRMGLALLLALPFALFAMPPRAKAAGLSMMVLFVSFFGAAVGLVRRRAEGQWLRLRLLPVAPWLASLDYLLVSTLADLVQTAPALALFAVVNCRGAAVGVLGAAAAAWVLSVAVLNALGMLLAAAVRSNAEVHLAAALSVGVVAFLSGLLPVPPPVAGLVGATSACSPLAGFAAQLAALAGGPAHAAGAMAAAGGAAALGLALAGAARAIGCKRSGQTPPSRLQS
jgi:hypothetical protein